MFGKYKPLWGQKPSLKSNYDAVIIGGGLHGLATAYFLAREHGMHDVAVIEKRYLGFGGSGRNTAIVRANQRTQENVPLYKEALDLWPILTKELDYNLMFFNCGNLNLMHSEAAMNAARMNVATAQFHGVESHLIDAKQCKELVPALNISEDITYPIFKTSPIRFLGPCTIRRAEFCAMMPLFGDWPRALPNTGCIFTSKPK